MTTTMILRPMLIDDRLQWSVGLAARPTDGLRYRDSPTALPLAARLLVALWVPLSVLAVLALISAVHGAADALELFITFVPHNPAAFALYAGWILSLLKDREHSPTESESPIAD